MKLQYLSEALEVEDEDVGQRPQTHLHHPLLQLLTVGALPGVVGGQLESGRQRRVSALRRQRREEGNTVMVW